MKAGPLLLLLACGQARAALQLFTPEQHRSIRQATDDAQAFYFCFKKDRAYMKTKDPRWKAPAWIDADLDAMIKRPVWKDSDARTLNEAQLWQAPFLVIYQVLQVFHSTPFNAKTGALAHPTPPQILKYYEDDAVSLKNAVDRLTRAKLGGSLRGRGAVVLSRLRRAVVETGKMHAAVRDGDTNRFKTSLTFLCAITTAAYGDLYIDPPAPQRLVK